MPDGQPRSVVHQDLVWKLYRILHDGSHPDVLFTKVWFGKCVGYVPDGSNPPDVLFTKVLFGKCVGYMRDGSEPQHCCSPRFGLENI